MPSRKYLVTGSGRGIGLEFVRQILESENSAIAVTRRGSAELTKLKEKFSHKLQIFLADVTSDEDVKKLMADLGRDQAIDILVNNAGVLLDANQPFAAVNLKNIERSFAVNTIAPMRMIQALLPNLLASVEPKVVSISSLMGSISDNKGGGYYGYRMSKAALNMMHKSFSIDYPQIASCVLHPGWVKTEMGGAAAPLSVEDSVRGLLQVIAKLSQKQTGQFFDHRGQSLPW